MTALLELDVRGVPLLALLLLAAPLTAVLSRHPLRLVGFGGSMVFSLDSAVLSFVLWVGLRAVTPASGSADGLGTWTFGLLAWASWLLGYAAVELRAQERRPAVRGYNIALAGAAGGLFVATALVVRASVSVALGGSSTPLGVGPWDLAAVVVASAAYVAMDLLLSALWVARVEGTRVTDALADPAALVGATTVLAVNSTAVLAALLLDAAPWTLGLLVPVAWALVHATRTGTMALTEHARAQALYEAAAGCQDATSRDQVVAAVVSGAEVATAAPAAVGPSPPGPGQVGVTFSDHGEQRWLVVGPRANQVELLDGDRTAVATLAALCEQSLARVDALDRIRYVAEHDALTGTLARGAFLAAVADGLTPATAVLFCDVDRFKAVNDTYGHRVGDEVLVAVARALEDAVAGAGTVGRLGGDELVVLLPRTTPEHTEALRQAVLASPRLQVDVGDAARVRVRLSVGVAAVPDLGPRAGELAPEDLAEALLERADTRMYDAKRADRAAT